MHKKVLVTGLDGFEQSIADRLIGAGRIPHSTKLIALSADPLVGLSESGRY